MPSKRSKGAGGGRGISGATHAGAGLPSRRKRLASKPPRSVPPKARERAAERTLRRRGEVPVRSASLFAGALCLFLAGVGAGVAATTWLDIEQFLAPGRQEFAETRPAGTERPSGSVSTEVPATDTAPAPTTAPAPAPAPGEPETASAPEPVATPDATETAATEPAVTGPAGPDDKAVAEIQAEPARTPPAAQVTAPNEPAPNEPAPNEPAPKEPAPNETPSAAPGPVGPAEPVVALASEAERGPNPVPPKPAPPQAESQGTGAGSPAAEVVRPAASEPANTRVAAGEGEKAVGEAAEASEVAVTRMRPSSSGTARERDPDASPHAGPSLAGAPEDPTRPEKILEAAAGETAPAAAGEQTAREEGPRAATAPRATGGSAETSRASGDLAVDETFTLSELLPPKAMPGAPPAKPGMTGAEPGPPSLLASRMPSWASTGTNAGAETVAGEPATPEARGSLPRQAALSPARTAAPPAQGSARGLDPALRPGPEIAALAMPEAADRVPVGTTPGTFKDLRAPSAALPAVPPPAGTTTAGTTTAGTTTAGTTPTEMAVLTPPGAVPGAATGDGAGNGAGSHAGGEPDWQRFAALSDQGPASAPMIALVIDDLGLNGPGTRRAVALPAPLTLAFLTYAPNLKRITAAARARGHELMVHLPMEPENPHENPGPKALLAAMGPEAIMERLTWGLSRFEGFVGLNNHMGSKFTSSSPGMAVVLAEVRRRGLLFLDSMTSPTTVGGSMARRLDVPYAERDVFLDNDYQVPGSIREQLDRLEAVARRQGYAVGIGHPHRATLDVLAEWIPRAKARGIRLIPISAVVRHRIKLAAGGGGGAG